MKQVVKYINMLKNIAKTIIILLIVGIVGVFGLSGYVAMSTNPRIVMSYKSSEEVSENAGESFYGVSDEGFDACREIEPQCILVLGCSVRSNGKPSAMLRDRLDAAIALYKAGAAPKLLLSGDNSIDEYNEPASMYKYAVEQGIPEEDIFLDYAGFSTYESVYRAKEVFCVDSMIIVTQKYHLFRSIKIADSLGINARGVSADQKKYSGRFYNEAREVLARDKDFVKCIFKPESTFLGEQFPITGEGTGTHIY